MEREPRPQALATSTRPLAYGQPPAPTRGGGPLAPASPSAPVGPMGAPPPRPSVATLAATVRPSSRATMRPVHYVGAHLRHKMMVFVQWLRHYTKTAFCAMVAAYSHPSPLAPTPPSPRPTGARNPEGGWRYNESHHLRGW